MPTTLHASVDGIDYVGTLYTPDKERDNGKVMFCLPGGGLTKDYFDFAPDYSFSDTMTAKGYTVIAMDHPGIASNAYPDDHPFFSPRDAAAVLTDLLDQWNDGRPVFGIGHSMGGMMIMLMQGSCAPFAGLGLFGSSAGGLDWGLSESEKAYINKPDDFARDLEALSLAKFGGPFTRSGAGPSGKSIVFGGETPELLERLRQITCELHSPAAMMSMTRGSFTPEVEAITVPLFFVFGDHDIGIPPAEVPGYFPNATSTEVLILDNTGHNHFAFSSIKKLCQRLDHWASKTA